ncbi:MAG: class I SAM-dependent methyltransferase [Peptococcia bacterium]
MKIAVTTCRDPEKLDDQAKRIAKELAIDYVPREGHSLLSLYKLYDLNFLLVVEKERIILRSQNSEFFWHPNMATLRLQALRRGKKDPMVEAMGLHEADQLLDCTFGLGADALVAAYIIGPSGTITGLESSPLIYFITKNGLENYGGEDIHLKALISPITILNQNYQEYLSSLPDKSYDIVYFDPMFRQGQEKSVGLQGLRPLANQEPLSIEAVREALRVARKRVVLKESRYSQEFERLGVTRISGGKYSPVAYGIWEVSKEKK